jgi:hypothetical protein
MISRRGDADFEAGEAEGLGDGVGEAGAEGFFDGFLGPEAHAEVGQLSPGQSDAFDRVDTFQLADLHPTADVIERHRQDLGGFRDVVGILWLEEEAADVRGGVGHGMSCFRTSRRHR